jgi:glycosyltransferase involved in cell wall biosynthesis
VSRSAPTLPPGVSGPRRGGGLPTIAFVSDAPTLTTGFGATTARMAGALDAAGWRPVCFGLKAKPADIGQTPYPIWPADRGGHWTDTLATFFGAMRPDLLVLNMDAYNAAEVLGAVRAAGWRGPVLSYVVFDGLPVGRHYLDVQRSCTAVLASSQTAAAYLRDNGVAVLGVAPPGVDQTLFSPTPDRSAVRTLAGVADITVIGAFATNTERKQLARVVAALPAIRDELRGCRLRLYMHCQPNGYWRLAELAEDLGVGQLMAFPAVAAFDERRGVPVTGTGGLPDAASAQPGGAWPASLSYVDRIRCCDVIVNVPHSGDIEQVILEAQACGVPVVHTDDQGVMTEAVGDGGVLLAARDVGIGRAGERIHHVRLDEIAGAVVSVVKDGDLRARLIQAGMANAAQYPWTRLETAICAAVGHCLGTTGRTRMTGGRR